MGEWNVNYDTDQTKQEKGENNFDFQSARLKSSTLIHFKFKHSL